VVALGHVYSPPIEATHGAYSTAETLLALSRQIMPQDPGRVAGPTYTPDQVQGAAALLQAQEASQPVPAAGRADLKTRLHGALRSRHGSADEKEIGPQEIDAVEVIEQLVGTIVDDPLIDEHIKPLVSKLEVPLLNAVMRDAEFFSAPSHPARQVINQLSRIAGQPNAEGLDASVNRSVNAALDHIIANSTENDNAFPEAERQLDRIVTEQHSLREANIAQVITDCEEQQALVKQRTGGAPVPQIDGLEVPEEWRQWLTRTKRLNIGDTVILGQDTERPQRALLAWVGENYATYVFVDDGGFKTATMTLQELAMQLRRGTADLVAESELTATDRGLYGMLGQMHEKVMHQASRDQLTGLVNRRELESQIETVLADARRDGSTHVVILHDLDHFHAINETCGRKTGDRAIKETGRVLQNAMDGRGLLARLDEDKFGALLQNTSEKHGFDIADKQRRSIEKSAVTWKGQQIQMSTSVGLVAVTETSEDTRAVLAAAAEAREQAKSEGGNRIEISKAPGSTYDYNRLKWIQKISSTLKAGRLELRCQKIAPIADGDPSKPHYEILLGLRDDEGNVMLPGEFIQAAELYGKAIDVDRWVIENTFEWMVNNKRKLITLDGFSINLSAQSLSDESILPFVLDQFTRSRLPPGKVLFEVTEHSEIASLSNAENFIRVLKEYGCRFLLDDFGTGHASYSYLKHLPLDYIKIDGLFIKDIAENPYDQAMVKSINEIGHFMGKKTVAEYVENERVLDMLREIGVDYAQGFGIEEPRLLSELS
jgi:diguanylate cyclase (GGDEF)-like protein